MNGDWLRSRPSRRLLMLAGILCAATSSQMQEHIYRGDIRFGSHLAISDTLPIVETLVTTPELSSEQRRGWD